MVFAFARAINYLQYRDIAALAVVFGRGYEDLWQEVAYERWWGRQFWYRASVRNESISLPFRVWRLEVLRNLEFESEIFPMIWGETDYYNFWKLRESLE